MEDTVFLSIVSPVYMAEKILPELVRQISEEALKISNQYEIILVEDGSPDNSWEVIEKICKENPIVKGFKLSRNFGQHYAIAAGLDQCKGEWVVVMDCDLQDKPSQMIKFYEKALEGYDIVQGRRTDRKDGFIKRGLSLLFYKALAYLSGYNQDNTIANYGIFNRKVINAIKAMPEKIRFFPTMIAWVGFKKITIDIDHGYRENGKSSYNLSKLFNLAIDIILAYSDKPLRLIVKFGLLTAFLSFSVAVYYIFMYFYGAIVVLGFTSLILSVWFLSGIIMVILGVIGLYIGKIFEGVKNRPIYLIDKKLNAQ